ncbi:MAG: twin-arginine translocase TatA/TatE family subunit [Campylobacterota bacterium]|nr:twin-arginine translocase TatA/TatE family subunit [Campylobacterota bacterium]
MALKSGGVVMFMPSWQELIPILIIVIIIFGAKKLPEIGSGLGKGIKSFKKSMKEINEEDVKKEDNNPKNEELEAEKLEKKDTK